MTRLNILLMPLQKHYYKTLSILGSHISQNLTLGIPHPASCWPMTPAIEAFWQSSTHKKATLKYRPKFLNKILFSDYISFDYNLKVKRLHQKQKAKKIGRSAVTDITSNSYLANEKWLDKESPNPG